MDEILHVRLCGSCRDTRYIRYSIADIAPDREAFPALCYPTICLPPSEVWSMCHPVRYDIVSIVAILTTWSIKGAMLNKRGEVQYSSLCSDIDAVTAKLQELTKSGDDAALTEWRTKRREELTVRVEVRF